jgi:hypothetical protein
MNVVSSVVCEAKAPGFPESAAAPDDAQTGVPRLQPGSLSTKRPEELQIFVTVT